MLKIAFDIAEGEYKDFYKKKFDEDDREDKKWPGDAVYYMTIPTDGCQAFITDQWDTFWANVEDSNNGYVFTGDEKTVKGKTFGGIFRIEQSQSDSGQVYDHTRLFRTRIAQDIRDGKAVGALKRHPTLLVLRQQRYVAAHDELLRNDLRRCGEQRAGHHDVADIS
jgi:hypothetical protein